VKPSSKIILWIGILFVALLVIITRARIETDISLFLPRSSTPQEQFLINQFRQGPGSKLLVVSLQGDGSKTLAQLSNSLTQKLKNNKAFTKVLNSEESATTEVEKFLFSNRYLLSDSLKPENFSPKSLHETLLETLKRITLSRGVIEKRYLGRDPTGEFMSILRSWSEGSLLKKKHGVWFSADGKNAFLVIEVFSEGFNLDQFEKAVHIIGDNFKELKKNSSATINMVGPPAFAVAARDSIRRDATKLSIIATCFVIGIIYLVYRSIPLVLLSMIPLFSGVLISVAAIILIFGSIHGITFAFGIVIIGVAIDYPLHLFSHIKDKESPAEAMDRIWPTIRLGVLTTSLGFISMIFSNFDGLIQLATFTVCGLISAALVTRHILPFIIDFIKLAKLSSKVGSIPFEILIKGKPLFYILLAGVIICVGINRNRLWENDIAQLSPVPKSQLALDKQMREELKLPNVTYWVIVKGKTEESVLQITERVTDKIRVLKNQGALSSFDTVTKYLPSIEKQTQRIKALPAIDQLKQNLRIAIKGLPFRENAFKGFIQEVSQAKNSKFLTSEALKGTILESRVNKLFYHQEAFWFSLILFNGDIDKKLIGNAINELPSENVFVLEPRKTSSNLVNRYRDRALLFFGWGCLIIVTTLRVALGQWGSVGRVLIPILGAVLTVIAILTSFKVQLSLFHLVSLLLVIGLGLDYALFLNHKQVSNEERSKTHHALLVCNLSTLMAFGTLAFSTTPVLRAIGTTVSVGAFLCFLFAFIFASKPKLVENSI
jgi:predicted exporter